MLCERHSIQVGHFVIRHDDIHARNCKTFQGAAPREEPQHAKAKWLEDGNAKLERDRAVVKSKQCAHSFVPRDRMTETRER